VEIYRLSWNTKDISAANSPNFTLLNSYVLPFFKPPASKILKGSYSTQILAIQSLHKQGIIHRDIKTDNIFLDDAGHLILADLGLAEDIATFEGGEAVVAGYSLWLEARARNEDDFPFLFVSEDNPLGTTGAAGTFWYTAPEVFRTEQYSFGVDYWSVGVIYHELITGHVST
jgi:serine/threonine protein kinase